MSSGPRTYKKRALFLSTREPVWPSGKAGKQKSFGSIPLRSPQTPSSGLRHPSLEEGAGKRCSERAVSLLFKKVVVCGQCLVTLSLTINETLKLMKH